MSARRIKRTEFAHHDGPITSRGDAVASKKWLPVHQFEQNHDDAPVLGEGDLKHGNHRDLFQRQHRDGTGSSEGDQAVYSSGNGSDIDMNDVESGSESEKSETELELERLVFGDSAGFRQGLSDFKDPISKRLAQESGEDADDDRDARHGLSVAHDDDLFFLDETPADAPVELNNIESKEGYQEPEAAWHDSDDERLRVSLMSVPRLRKLRNYEGEDVISGLDYINRLRKQYELLHPTPEWAKWKGSNAIPHRKKRSHRASSELSGAEEDGEDSENSADDDTIEIHAPPSLADLLQTSMSLTRSNISADQPGVKRKSPRFRPEVINIDRLPNIAPTQPHVISTLSIHPSLPLILSSGVSSNVYLHHLLPYPTPPDKSNPLITSLYVKNTPITTAAFSPLDSSANTGVTENSTTSDALAQPKIFLSSRRRFFHTWNLPTGTINKITRIHSITNSSSKSDSVVNTTQRSFEILKPSPCGRYIALKGTARAGGIGVVNILDATTMQFAAQARVESYGASGGGIPDFAWWADGNGMTVVSNNGECSEWSMERKHVIRRWRDIGGIGITTCALGGKGPTSNNKKRDTSTYIGPDMYIALGTSTGLVTVYSRENLFTDASTGRKDGNFVPTSQPQPIRTLENLTTPISNLVFSPAPPQDSASLAPRGTLLVMSSKWKRDALRLVHMPDCAVYKNWPTSRTPLGRVSAVAWGWARGKDTSAPHGQELTLMLVVGNEQGHLRAWQVKP